MKRTLFFLGACLTAFAQDISRPIVVEPGQKPPVAVPDFRGAGDAQNWMTVFNGKLWSELQGSGQIKLIPKTLYPLNVPQQPADFRPPVNGKSQGPWLSF